jgi:hypothetical protein
MATTTPKIIKRSQLAEYLNTTPVGTSKTWSRIGFGVEGKSGDYNPEIDERQFIDEDSPNSSIRRYAYSSEFDINAATDSPVFEYLDTLRVSRAIYADAETEYLEVRLYQPVDGKKNTFSATLLNVAIAVNSIGDAAEDPLTLSATVSGRGDPIEGEFNYETSTFTAITDLTPPQESNPS